MSNDAAITGDTMLTRRALVAGGAAICLVPIVSSAAQATPAEMADAIRSLTGGAALKPGRVKLVLPELAENGNIVALSVSVDSPMTDADHVKSLHVFSELNPVTTLVRFHVSPRAGRNPTLLTNIRLADSQRVTAIAAMSDGSFWSGDANVVVTIAACIDGGWRATVPQPTRIVLPASARKGEVFQVKTIIQHEMESGFRRDDRGLAIPRHIITSFVVTYAGAEIFRADVFPGVAANPYFAFTTTATETGEVVFTWTDDRGDVTTERRTLTVT